MIRDGFNFLKLYINPSGSHENRSGIWPMIMAFLPFHKVALYNEGVPLNTTFESEGFLSMIFPLQMKPKNKIKKNHMKFFQTFKIFIFMI